MFRFWHRKGFWTILITALVLLIVMRLSSSNRQEITGLGKLVRAGYAPVQNGVDMFGQSMKHVALTLVGGTALEARIEALQSENNLLSLENMQLREDKAEVVRLTTMLAFKQYNVDQYELEAAKVIARSPNNWYQTLTIDKGAQNGLAVDMPVINPYGLVGKVVSVTNVSAQVWLITDREMAVGAILQETRETRGIVEGLGDNVQLQMINIPYNSQVSEGEQIITSGLSDIYPPGIPIGVIQNIKKEANGLVLSAGVEPSVKFDQLEEVLVIKKYIGTQAAASKGV